MKSYENTFYPMRVTPCPNCNGPRCIIFEGGVKKLHCRRCVMPGTVQPVCLIDGHAHDVRERPIEDYDDYQTAMEYVIKVAMSSGDGVLLRSGKTMADALAEVKPQRDAAIGFLRRMLGPRHRTGGGNYQIEHEIEKWLSEQSDK